MSAPDLAWVRSEVGDAPTDDVLNGNYDRLGGKAMVALEIWRTRYSNFARNPTSLGADGLTLGTAPNLLELRRIVQHLEVLARAEGTLVDDTGSGFMSRPDRRGPFWRSEEDLLSGGRYC